MRTEEWTALLHGIDQQVDEIAARNPESVDASLDHGRLLEAWDAPVFATIATSLADEPTDVPVHTRERELSLR